MREFFLLVKSFNLKGLFINPTENSFLQFFRYAFVGGIATVADWGVLYLFTEIGLYYLFSGIIAFFAGLLVNFLLSKFFVFNGSETKVGAVLEFVGYAMIGAIGLGLTVFIMYLLTECIGFYYMLSKVIATVIVLFWNYIARKKLLYSNK